MFTWSAVGDDRDDFAINEGVLTFNSPPDHEGPGDRDRDNVYEITVVASDGTNEGMLEVTITVDRGDRRPEVSGTATYSILVGKLRCLPPIRPSAREA